ncbi:MAG TPA: DsbA family protein [Solirubrobacteraceae bacterium]|nr:DsbA family protein [Solirubrobacteraceae bacterium]
MTSNVTPLGRRRPAAVRRRQVASLIVFYFDLGSPYTYLAAERADRMFAGLAWVPATCARLRRGASVDDVDRAAVALRAETLGLPLIWPVGAPPSVVRAMRVASLAAERGAGAAFVLAATRLTFCGSFDIDDPEILVVAASGAGIDTAQMSDAADDAGRDAAIEATGRRLVAAGAGRLPVLQVEQTLFCGEDRVGDAAIAARIPASTVG